MQLQPGTLVLRGKYRIERLLGEGASAEVYLVALTRGQGQRALKILRRDLPGVGSTKINDYRSRFEREYDLQQQLLGNPRIIQAYDADDEDGSPALVMEYAAGGSLQDELDALMTRGERATPARCAEVLQAIAMGLQAMHERGWVHRDVKPRNVLLERAGGRAKLGDLGVAQTDQTRTRTDGQAWEHPGTPPYCSPEHANGLAYLTPAADVYALGVIGYRMLTGQVLAPATSGQPPVVIDGPAPEWLKALIQRMLAWDYRERPQYGGAVAEEVGRGLVVERERESQLAARKSDLRGQVEGALKAGRLVEADTLMDELLQLDADDLAAQTLARRVNRALVEEKQRLAREERLRHDEERARSKREDEERQTRLAEAETLAERKRLAEAAAQQQREDEQRRWREAEAAAVVEQKRKADEAAWKRREEEQRQRLAAEAKRQAAPQPPLAPAPRPAPPPTGAGKSRRAVLIGAGTLGALGLGWLATRGGGEASPATPTPAPTTVLQRIGADRAVLSLALGMTMEFVRVPAGEFVMGSDKAKDRLAFDDELPQHKLTLPEYLIGKTEVTVAQFAAYVKATGAKTSASSDLASKATHPVVDVTWDDCIAFCAWASKLGGGEVLLPSEAEWEKAARGTDGRIYPWGNEAPDDTRLNYTLNVKDTTAVGKFGAKGQSPFGCDDMAGNVWEWTRSLWGKDGSKPEFGYPYMTRQAEREEVQAGREVLRVLRGGSFGYSALDVRCACRYRYSPSSRYGGGGFRVILRPPSP